MKKALAIILTAAMLLCIFAGCSNSDSDPTENQGDQPSAAPTEATLDSSLRTDAQMAENRYPSFTAALTSAPTDMAPWNTRQPGKSYWLDLCYDYLFYSDPLETTLETYLKPIIGKSWKEIDELHWEVEIFDNVYDTDGNHLTASDVVFCYNHLMESGFAMQMNNFESIEATGDYTVVFTWKTPVDSFTDVGQCFNCYLFTEKAYNDHNFASEVCGTGPYKVTDYVSGSYITIDARDDYWQTDESQIIPNKYRNIQTIRFEVVAESNQNVVGLRTGSLDFTTSVPAESLNLFADGGELAEDYTAYTVQGTSVYMMLCNMENAITSDINFRLACYYAIDKEQVALAAGFTSPLEAFGSPSHPDVNPDWANDDNYNNDYDPELAKDYLSRSSYNGEKLTILGFNTEIAKNSMTIIQLMLKNVGIDVEINALETSMVNSMVTDPTTYDLLFYFVGGNTLIDCLNRCCNNTELGNGKALAFIDDPELQALYEECVSFEGRTPENVQKLYDHIIENAYFKTLFTQNNMFVYSNKVVEPYLHGTGTYINAATFAEAE